MLMEFLRDRQKFLEELSESVSLEKKILTLFICNCFLFAIYGGIIGSTHSFWQTLASAIKLPALYLLTLIICLPALYFFDLLFSSHKRTFQQYLTLLLSAMSMISVMLIGFAPITLFFRLSVNNYDFFKLLNVVIFILTGVIGVHFFYKGMIFLTQADANQQRFLLQTVRLWLLLYALVGSQLGWTLRPFFGDPSSSFELFRAHGGSFSGDIIVLILQKLGLMYDD